jgi:hypothetical protein
MAFVEVKAADRSAVAAKLLEAAKAAGQDPTVVRSVFGGFEVPDELLQRKEPKPAPSQGRRRKADS